MVIANLLPFTRRPASTFFAKKGSHRREMGRECVREAESPEFQSDVKKCQYS